MKFLKLLSVFILVTTLVSNAKPIDSLQNTSTKKIIILGTVTGDIKGKDKVYITDLNAYRDTATIKDGKFVLEIPYKGAQTLFMNAQYEPGYRPVTVVFDLPGTINVLMDVKTQAVIFTGLETPSLYNGFTNRNRLMIKEIDKELTALYGTAYPNQNDPNYHKCQIDRNRLSKEKMVFLLKEQVEKYPDAYATAYILSSYGITYPLSLQEELYNKLGAKAKASDKGKEFFSMINGTKNSAIGNKVADFIIDDTNGKPISFSQFKGKYVLVDFWASWCGPCRASFPRMLQIYEAFHQQGLEILSISVDEKKANWLKAVEEEKLPWAQGLDTRKIAKSSFAVSAIPNLFLITPEGKILLKELGSNPQGGGEIEKKLEEIYGKQVEPVKKLK